MPGKASRLLERAAQQELDLCIYAAKIAIRPPLEGLEDGRIQSKRK